MYQRLFTMVAITALMAGCSSNPQPSTPQAKRSLDDDAHVALASMKNSDPGLQSLLDNSYGYAIFPSVGAGGVIVGGAYGRGLVYQQGRFAGYADVTQASIGAELGGQTYTELVVFHDQDAFWRFQSGKVTFGAEASAVAIKAGAASATQFTNGVATFMQSNGGLMANASLNGQQFTFSPGSMPSQAQAGAQ